MTQLATFNLQTVLIESILLVPSGSTCEIPNSTEIRIATKQRASRLAWYVDFERF
jgi:hypothetical protein